MVKSNRGITLVSILVATAVVGIVAATLASLYESMTIVWVKSNANIEADNLQRLVQGVLSQRDLCREALRDPAGNPIQFPAANAEVPVGSIQIDRDPLAAPPPLQIARAPTILNPNPQEIAPGVVIQNIFLRGTDANSNGVADEPLVTKQTHLAGIAGPVTTVAVQLVIRFAYVNAVTRLVGGNVLDDRVINTNIYYRNSDRQIVGCDLVVQDKQVTQCSLGQASPPHEVCLQINDYAGQPCTVIPYLREIDQDGRGICGCQTICNVPDPTPPPAPLPPPLPPLSPTALPPPPPITPVAPVPISPIDPTFSGFYMGSEAGNGDY